LAATVLYSAVSVRIYQLQKLKISYAIFIPVFYRVDRVEVYAKEMDSGHEQLSDTQTLLLFYLEVTG
jgi:hypothetical protein